MITFDHVTKYYGSNVGLDDFSLHIDKGEFVFVVGASGAGKTTFIKLLMKELDVDAGTIEVAGRTVTSLRKGEIPMHRRSMGIVFQDFRLLPNKTVYENIQFVMQIVKAKKKDIKKRVPQVLALVGLEGKEKNYPHELSAGEQQRVAIARALANRPQVLIADEPTGNLDPNTAWEIMNLMERINNYGTTVLMVTHAKDIVDEMKKRVITIHDGKLVSDEKGGYKAVQGDAYGIVYDDEDTVADFSRTKSNRN